MTDTPDDGGPEHSAETDADGDAFERVRPRNQRAARTESDRDLRDYLFWSAFGVLLFLGAIGTLQFYFNASSAISIWIAPDYVPILQAAFNLAIVLGAAAGLSALVRRTNTV